MKPFYLLVVLWGNKFCHYFLDLLVVSLLADNNLPAIAHKAEHVFIIATTKEDWDFLQLDSRFKQLSELIKIEFLDISVHLVDSDMGKMHLMSLGHRAVSRLAYENRGVGVFLTPDMVITESALLTLQKILSKGYQAILCPAVRFEYIGCMRAFEERGFLSGEKLSITGQELMSVVLANVHSETQTWMWDGECYADNPVITLKRLSGKNNYVLHGYSWAPLAIDYSSLDKHDVSTFDKSTLDQDYVYKNFGNTEKIYLVKDTDELALASFSTEEEYHISTLPRLVQRSPCLGRAVRRDNLARIYYCEIHDMDPLKRDLVKIPVLMHAEPRKPEWKEEIQIFQKEVLKAISKKPPSQYPAHVLYSDAVSGKSLLIECFMFLDAFSYPRWRRLLPTKTSISRARYVYSVRTGFRDIVIFIMRGIEEIVSIFLGIVLFLLKAVNVLFFAILLTVMMVYSILSFLLMLSAYHFFRLFCRRLTELSFPELRIDAPPQSANLPSFALIMFVYLPRYFLYRVMDVGLACYRYFKKNCDFQHLLRGWWRARIMR